MIELLLEAERQITAGRLDEAGRLYRQAVDADPRNSIAVVGLARVALERGDDAEALRLGREALRIDADNVAARRLVARLEEVMTARGEPVAAEPTPPTSAEPEAAPQRTADRRRGILGRILRRG
jgi:thioredoxin-like negative regulator of GroEL